MSRAPYVREIQKFRWFFRQPRYLRYMTRELSCLFIGAYTLLLVCGIGRLAEGRAAYEAFLEALKSPLSVVLHLLALGFSIYHSVTWFNLTPKALPLQIGEELMPGWVVAGAHYLVWVLLSLGILFFAGVF